MTAASLKLFIGPLALLLLAAMQADDITTAIPGVAGQVVNLLVALLMATGALKAAGRWIEGRAKRSDAAEDARAEELRRLRYDLARYAAGYGEMRQAALSAGAEHLPPALQLTPPGALAQPPLIVPPTAS